MVPLQFRVELLLAILILAQRTHFENIFACIRLGLMSKHTRSTSDEPDSSIQQVKKTKNDIDIRALLDAAYSIKTFHPGLRTAYNINTALTTMFDKDSKVSQIGAIVSYFEHQKPPKQAQVSCRTVEVNLSLIDIRQKQVLDKVISMQKQGVNLLRRYAFGRLGPMTIKRELKVTRRDCEFNGKLGQLNKDILHSWLQNTIISRYGDTADLQTKVDINVRNAREINADEFTVEPELLDEIAKIWKENFIPGDVRVEPHKIHIYGEGGHFKAHRDALEHGLVGKFLVGLYDSAGTSSFGNFHIDSNYLHTAAGSWVAFHPDVPHEVTPLAPGCARAVIAFKLFSTGDPNEAATRFADLVDETEPVLQGIPRPFGIILSRKYSTGTEVELNGYDAVMLSAARQINGTRVRVIPVVIRLLEERYYDEEESLTRNYVSTQVKPFTQAHVDLQLGRRSSEVKEECAWFEWFKEVPFYSWDLRSSAAQWQHYEHNIGYPEPDGTRHDSLHLSCAIVVVPGKAEKASGERYLPRRVRPMFRRVRQGRS
ncbi:uncharacterized protein BT62DRAFT_363070 [Guyanagaster necrorhizus]|uniref:Prolyl 4-hydroxylase alpha subunit Fe(2+) 2OG dioxygenase domain-containing protein n=1 Tax=Guyanagaster necrorhizus TaxID=856835 RepID=A0A9P7VMZ7_9AGAR|nr:uncharacterized protein BT62DRAFT_363070 [Guyanagaster necrorhizus MCA 3950]KAG7442901.1 hypothetical protein BT62DRAFT_363070 [Guyanagaster necrorhizus MCA 3950]